LLHSKGEVAWHGVSEALAGAVKLLSMITVYFQQDDNALNNADKSLAKASFACGHLRVPNRRLRIKPKLRAGS
jgi:2C-methyl-D-erythritol 2,4-cyclodiphosphate synthase